MHASSRGPRRPRIGIVVPFLSNVGGVATVAEFVCETIERSGAFDLSLVSLPSSARDPLGVGLTRPASWFRGVRTAQGIWRGRPYVSVGAMAAELEFQRYRPRPALARALADCDLIQVVTGMPAPACAVLDLGKPVAVHCCTRAPVERESQHRARGGPGRIWRKAMTAITDRMDRIALLRADAIQVMNSWILDYARELNTGREKPIVLIRPGVNTSRFVPGADRELRSEPYILCVGRLSDPRKNVGLLLQAYAGLAASIDRPVRLVLAGFGAPPDAFWHEVGRLGLCDRVSFVEAPDEEALVALYQRATVFALTSDEEGLGIVLLEAMSCGIPVVSTASGGPDSIIRDGVDGYLVPVGDPAPLQDCLQRLVLDEVLNHRMGTAARKTALARFDAHFAGHALLRTYDELLGGAQPARQSATR